MPKNTGAGLYIAGFVYIAGFAIIWHIMWLIPVGILGALVCIVVRMLNQETEYTIPAAEIARMEVHETI
jgi:cytochrome o ubiquinol oxidase subunit 1